MPSGWDRYGNWVFLGAWILLSIHLCACSGPVGAGDAGEDRRGPPDLPAAADAESTAPSLRRGEELYGRHCSVCHGETGAGDGTAAYLLSPAPRDFTAGRFRLVSTTNGAPTEEDLIATLRRGMPGSSMPPWEWMPEGDLVSLARYVRELALEGGIANLLAWAESEEEEMTEDEAREITLAALTPGEPVEVGAPPPADRTTQEQARELYVELCSSCHGEDGTGRNTTEQWNEDGTPTSPRDFTAGIFKGGTTQADLVRRILAGMPGSPMPLSTFEDPVADANKLAAYVRSMIEPGAEERVLQHRRTIHVRRISVLPAAADDPGWRSVPEEWIALTPLWWRHDRVEGVRVRAVHDGERIAVHLSWADPQADAELLGHETFSDAAALQLTGEADPPLFSMGETGRPVDIVLWKAAWEQDLAGVRGVLDRYPATMPDLIAEVPEDVLAQYMTARASGNSQAVATRSSTAESLSAAGFGTLANPRGGPSIWTAEGVRDGGRWSVALVRPLSSPSEEEVTLRPGDEVFLAFAVWDGGGGDRNGQKAVSVWHVLDIER